MTHTPTQKDHWTEWVLHRRHGNTPDARTKTLARLAKARDTLLDQATFQPGDTVLDIGCGDGLLGFAILERTAPHGQVIFADISHDLLEICRDIATDLGYLNRCQFLHARASDLSNIQNTQIDSVALRSVLIYEPDKQTAFHEFFRVLRPNGRLFLSEPINSFSRPARPDTIYLGRDMSAAPDLVRKIRAVYQNEQFPAQDPMHNFDERDLLHMAGTAGFTEIHLTYTAHIEPRPPEPWKTALHRAPNPNVPTLHEAMQKALTPQEQDRFTSLLAPQMAQPGHWKHALAHIHARKPSPALPTTKKENP